MSVRLQLRGGLEVLENWAEAASQAERNIVYEALFTIGDGSAFLIYDVFGDPADLYNFVIMVKEDLALKIALRRASSSFEILHVGALEDGAPAPAGADLDEQ
jgi:hypothetical protein